jgi:hypothetical protein
MPNNYKLCIRIMAKLILNTEDVEEDFFSDCRLLAIGAALPGYTLCWWLNRACDFNFVREPEMDICVQEGKAFHKKSGGLFDEVPEVQQELFYFPVYKHDLPYYNSSVLLYTNTIGGKKLMPDVRFADFLMLIPFASYIEPGKNVYNDLTGIPNISWVREIDLEPLKHKRNLIV